MAYFLHLLQQLAKPKNEEASTSTKHLAGGSKKKPDTSTKHIAMVARKNQVFSKISVHVCMRMKIRQHLNKHLTR
jgi:hypothetical protein